MKKTFHNKKKKVSLNKNFTKNIGPHKMFLRKNNFLFKYFFSTDFFFIKKRQRKKSRKRKKNSKKKKSRKVENIREKTGIVRRVPNSFK